MMMILILSLFMVREVEMMNPIPVAQLYILSSGREQYLGLDGNSNPALKSDERVLEIYRLNDTKGFLLKEITYNYYALPNEVPAAGDQLILSDTGTLFSLGGRDCVYESFDATNPTQLMVEGFSGCINQNLTFSDPCDSSRWYLRSWRNCSSLQDCNACFFTGNETCRECSSGLASNGATCEECPPGHEADTCGWECVEITSTEAPTTTSSAAFFKPVGVMMIMTSFLLA